MSTNQRDMYTLIWELVSDSYKIIIVNVTFILHTLQKYIYYFNPKLILRHPTLFGQNGKVVYY